mmetsp:Transcript_34010/g.56313  ORF Transcript_34010/g.56313 Transcript_34010/m.56313 type:complete len:510 (-) Transcript_34010:159-1688(-)
MFRRRVSAVLRRGAAMRTINTETHRIPLTKIVATIGPASEEIDPLTRCVAAGLNVMRVNFSHATIEEFHLRRKNLRATSRGGLCGIMLDTKGPEIRMGGLRVCKETGNRKAKVVMKAGSELLLTKDIAFDGASDEKTLYVAYPPLAEKLQPGAKVLLDDGLISLRVIESNANGTVLTEVLNTSEIGERKGVNLPGIITGLPPLSEKDQEDIRFGIEHDIDMVAASFVRSGEGVREIRKHIAACHAQYAAQPEITPQPLIISKIESTEALDNLEEIVAESDGIMVARGDLGVEIPIEQVVTWQKEIVALCVALGKPVVVATQMLESMQANPRPTRAEVADVTNAVLEQADAVMLSGESANGKYPDVSVAMQQAIIRHVEEWAAVNPSLASGSAPEVAVPVTEPQQLAMAVCTLADDANVSCIIVEERGDGKMARAVSACRSSVPVVVQSASLKVCRQLSLFRGVVPVHDTGPLSIAAAFAALQLDFSYADATAVLIDAACTIRVVNLSEC